MIGTDPRIRVLPAIAEIPAVAWNGCAHPVDATSELVESMCERADSKSQGAPYNPFISHEFLSALEASKSATGRPKLRSGASVRR